MDQNAVTDDEPSLDNNGISAVCTKAPSRQPVLTLGDFEVVVDEIIFCLIDDCKKADIPLLKVALSGLNYKLCFGLRLEGSADVFISCDYYNRNLSGWEPFMEPCRTRIVWWWISPASNLGKLFVKIEGDDVLNINLTSSLLELYSTVMNNWSEDNYIPSEQFRDAASCSKSRPENVNVSPFRRRSSFVPFILKNDTGCSLWFSTIMTNHNSSSHIDSNMASTKNSAFPSTEVLPGEEKPFSFEEVGKFRHKDSNDLKIHQLSVCIERWKPVSPVSVDKVGIYFRHAIPTDSEFPPTRIVFAITLDASARKLITVRSALLLSNKLEDAVNVRLENETIQLGDVLTVQVPAGVTWPIPLLYNWAMLWAWPACDHWLPCTEPFYWDHVFEMGGTSHEVRVCNSTFPVGKEYRFSVCIRHDYWGDSVRPTREVLVKPGHTIFLLPPLTIENLLPFELHFQVVGVSNEVVPPGKSASVHNVDIRRAVVVKFSLEHYHCCEPMVIQPGCINYLRNLPMLDSMKRTLTLKARVLFYKGVVKLEVFAPYWFINHSGLPLIFRQDGKQKDSAGQSNEHEMRSIATPFLFSFSDPKMPFMCIMRIGNAMQPDGHHHWCQRFQLEKGLYVRCVRITPFDSQSDLVYNIGITVDTAQGRCRSTQIVTFSPRFILANQTNNLLHFAQKCDSESARPTHSVLCKPSCAHPFHWRQLDSDKLLCVRIEDCHGCQWSGGFSIEKIDSFHINVRSEYGNCRFVHVAIGIEGATYTAVFTDSDKVPTPFRIDNYSEVPITFYQSCVTQEKLHVMVRPKSSVPYALDEPTLPSYITCCVPGGNYGVCKMNAFGENLRLAYENFIYIAMCATFQENQTNESKVYNTSNISASKLVLDVVNGTSVVLSQKEPGRRSQLWRLTSTGMLQNEGSLYVRDCTASIFEVNAVLDISDATTVEECYTPLKLRKPNSARRSTQTWNFTDDGRLSCLCPNVFVQCAYGRDGLVAGNAVVLGPTLSEGNTQTMNNIPVEQAIKRQRLWPGSGMLSLTVVADGPTRVLQVTDVRQKALMCVPSECNEWVTKEDSAQNKCQAYYPKLDDTETKLECQICVNLIRGIGISVVNNAPEELVYATFCNIVAEYCRTNIGLTIDGSIGSIKIDNQLFDAEIPVFLYTDTSTKSSSQPALHLTLQKMNTNNDNVEAFKHLMVTVKSLMLHVEEKLMWKLIQFIGCLHFSQEPTQTDDIVLVENRPPMSIPDANNKRYYFGSLKLSLRQVRLSVFTSSRLPYDLQIIKDNMGVTLIKFEEAKVELDPFVRLYAFETKKFFVDAIMDHYKEELKGQASKILGSFDFLGNPVGLMNDVSEGLTGFITEGNVGGLLKNVTHGLSNSAAKVVGTLSHGLGSVAVDAEHEETRKKLCKEHCGTSSGHLVAGLKGLGYGILGGITSIVTQTYEGVSTHGFQGLFTGFGRGVVGTVAKPTVGLLDFTAGAARAIRETSRSQHHAVPSVSRPPRVCSGPGGLLPLYSIFQSHGQQYLHSLNGKNYSELFIAYEQVHSGNEDLHVLISNLRVFFLAKDGPITSNIILCINHSHLQQCVPLLVEEDGQLHPYLELTVVKSAPTPSLGKQEVTCKRPRVRCDSENIAHRVVQQINCAKRLSEEMRNTLSAQNFDV